MEQQEPEKTQNLGKDHKIMKKKDVKVEPRGNESESNAESEDTNFLDDLLKSADEIAAAVADASSKQVKTEPDENTNDDNEDIDPSFFDEILVRTEDERRKAKVTRKPFRLKRERLELEEGEVDEEDQTDEVHKQKTKKSKYSNDPKDLEYLKKHKNNDDVESSCVSSSLGKVENNRPRLQVRAEFRSFMEPIITQSQDNVPSPEPPQTEIEIHIGASTLYQPIPFQLSVKQEEPIERKPEKELSAEEKLTKAFECVLNARRAFQKAKLEQEKQFYSNDSVFIYTPTVRKLPTSSSHFTQQIYDNRSPLHTVNNVTFQFNSMATRLNLEEWGLESLPSKSRSIARTLSYDVDTLYTKKQSIKIPDKIQKLSHTKTNVGDKELCEKSSSTLFMNVMVQTDEVKVIPNRRRDFYRDVCLQFTPPTSVIGTQTNPAYTGEGAELPLFKVIREMNENQIEAVDCFVQLILEPSRKSGIELYKQRKRLDDIYRISQIPSNMALSVNCAENETDLPIRMPSTPPPPSFYKSRDLIKKEPDSYYHSSGRHRTPAPFQRHDHYNETANDSPSSSVKFYGRGGMRR